MNRRYTGVGERTLGVAGQRAPYRSALALAATVAVSACTTVSTSPTTTGTSDRRPAQLDRVRVVESLPTVPGYDRSCRPSHGCVFGPAWSDDTSAPQSHNGCSTRVDAIAQAARDLLRAGRCKVTSGVLDDPYTGRTVPFTSSTIGTITVDHLIPLHRAWALGAASWTPQRRAAFANDVDIELIVTTAAINAAKGDQGIGDWQPPNVSYQCTYAMKYVRAALAYDLPLTRQDRDAAAAAFARC